MPLASVGEIELSYERAGLGSPLLLIMGMSGTFSHWDPGFLDDLRRDFDTIVYDHRGIGSSSRLQGPITIAQFAEDAAGLLAELEIDSAHVLGISMGGMVAQELALAHPARIRTLALGCTYCGGEGSALAGEDVLRKLAEAMSSGRPCSRSAPPGKSTSPRPSPRMTTRTRVFWRSAFVVPCRLK